MGYDTTDTNCSLPRDPGGSHSWARQPAWDTFVAVAIQRFLDKGGKILYCFPVGNTQNKSDPKKKTGSRRTLPQMTPDQHKLYLKLKSNGIDREEALKQACPHLLGK